MSTHSYSGTCPKCECESLMISSSNRPIDQTSGECLECGYYYYTKEDRMDLKELNWQRTDADMEELSALPKTKNQF